MPLDSDSPNADAQLHVEFYTYDKEPYKDKPFVRIMVPGDKTNVIDQPAREDHQRRFQRQWLHYQAQHADAQVIGVPLLEWHKERPLELTDGQLQELTILKFLTVEQLAMASDAQVAKVGMGAAGLRNRARSYLASRNSLAAGAAFHDQQNQIEELKAMIANLTAMRAAEPLQAARPKGKRGGWNKGKKKVSVNVQHNDAPASAAGGQ